MHTHQAEKRGRNTVRHSFLGVGISRIIGVMFNGQRCRFVVCRNLSGQFRRNLLEQLRIEDLHGLTERSQRSTAKTASPSISFRGSTNVSSKFSANTIVTNPAAHIRHGTCLERRV
jgi:hypothetical protein